MKSTGGLLWPFAEQANDIAVEREAWGRQWVKFLGEQFNPAQVWLGWADENGRTTWTAGWPQEEVPPAVITNAEGSPFPHEALRGQHLLPLQFDGATIGWLFMQARAQLPPTPEVLHQISLLTSILAWELGHERERKRLQQAEHSISHLLQSSLEVETIMPQVLDILAGALGADALLALSFSASTRKFDLLASHGTKQASPSQIWQTHDSDQAACEIIDQRRAVWIEDLQDHSGRVQPIHPIADAGVRHYLAVPLIGHNLAVGALEILWQERGGRPAWNEAFLERMTRQLGFALERSALLKDLRRASQGWMNGHSAMLEGLARIMGIRDHETEEHTRRVGLLAMRMVEHVRIPAEDWSSIRMGALLHDIGKLGVPDSILLKPGSLTDAERQMMQMHVIYGYNILAPITNARQTLDIIRYHHERWDGGGYPEGLKGDQIPLVARLFSVVDVFDALTCDRPYRTAWLRTQALDFIRDQAGRQFDPGMVEAFLEIADGTAGRAADHPY